MENQQETTHSAEQVEADSITEVEDTVVAEEQEVDEASVKLEELSAELAKMEDNYLRAQAEIVNMRNRFQKEREDLAKYRSQDLAKELLPALDNLERALDIEVTDEHGESLKKGIEMVQDSILNAFKTCGITIIPAKGEIFDPTIHQAVQTMPIEEGQQEEEIIHVLQNGYQLNDRVLRPAMVIVAQ